MPGSPSSVLDLQHMPYEVTKFDVTRNDFAQTSWTKYVRDRVPARVARSLQFVAVVPQAEKVVVWWYAHKTPIELPYSEDFPTELDVARLCVECP